MSGGNGRSLRKLFREMFLIGMAGFGGGDAYLTIADGLFVQSGMVTDDYFYSQLIPVTNVLPGSILCKILAGNLLAVLA